MECFVAPLLAMTEDENSISSKTFRLFRRRRLSLVQMIRQRQRHAVAQSGFGQLLFQVEQDAAVAAISQLRIELAKRLDQIGLAVEIDRIPVGGRFHLIDADRTAALRL
jgi:hypothetical protein